MLTTILGNLGSGKTLLMVIFSYYSKRKIVANFKINFEGREVEQFDRDKFIRAEYENCIILLDEAYNYLESRISGSENNRIFGYILFQSRKKNVEMYLTAQLFSTLDKRFRELSDITIVAIQRENSFDDFHYFIDNKMKIVELHFDFLKILPFFEMYDTNQVILTLDEKIQFDTKTSSDKEEEIEKYANIIEDYYNNEGLENVTKSMVKLYATKNKLPNFLVDSIFTTLKMRKKLKEKI